MNADGPNRRKANAAGGRAFRVAVRLGAASHAVRTRLARSWNFVPQVVAYPSYGTTNRVRVLGRVLLASPVHGANRGLRGAPPERKTSAAGGPSPVFPSKTARVDIEIGGTVHQVHADPAASLTPSSTSSWARAGRLRSCVLRAQQPSKLRFCRLPRDRARHRLRH